MKKYIKYGSFLAIIFILHSIIFYFWKQGLLYEKFTGLYLWYLSLYILFMLLAIFSTSQTIQDSGTYFKIALVTFCIANFTSHAFDFTLSNICVTELDPIFLEESKKRVERWGQLTGENSLKTFEKVALMEETIEKELTFTDFLSSCLFYFLLIGIPLSILTTFIGKQLIRLQQKGFYFQAMKERWINLSEDQK